MANGEIPEEQLTAKQRSNRDYYARNKERMLARVRANRAANVDAHRERDARYYRAHVETKKAAVARYKQANPDKVRGWYREWAPKNRDRIRRLARESEARCTERRTAYQRQWRRENPEKQAEYRHRRRALEANGEGFTASDLLRIHDEQSGRCLYCSCDLALGFEADHFIPLILGGSNKASNIVLACMPCNRSKASKLPWEWRPEMFPSP